MNPRGENSRPDVPGHNAPGARPWAWLAVALLFNNATAAEVPPAPSTSFRTHILPLLTKAGCNAGACHGAATGRGGFKLSLLGYEPDEDHDRITRELSQRRIDPAAPDQSLLLLKASDRIDHEGGRRLPRSGESYARIRDWIAAGAPRGARDLVVTSIQVTPPESLNCTAQGSFPLRVTATLSNGTTEDVTPLALFTSNDDAVAEVDKAGLVTPRAPGLGSIMVRYSGLATAARIGVPHAATPLPAGALDDPGSLDAAIRRESILLRVPTSPPSEPGEFLRRVHLDLLGRLPTAVEAREYLARADSPQLRRRTIDELLTREAFVDRWTLKLADLLQVGPRRSNPAAARTWHAWLREQVARDAPLNQLAFDLITAEGDATLEGPPNFPLLASDPRDLGEHVGSMFLGIQIACARCHAHPSDRWTQDDYHRFAAYFARVARDGTVVRSVGHGEVTHPKTDRPLDPRPLGEAMAVSRAATPSSDRRRELGEWIRQSPLFARAFVNRVCRQLLGHAPVEPVDDLRPTNPPTHPLLLERLAEEFVRGEFRLRHLVREIANTGAYQLSSRTLAGNAFDSRLYTHAALRPLTAEVFLDAVAQVTGLPEVFEGEPEGTRATQLVGPVTASPVLDLLGRCSRERRCTTTAGGAGGGLAQALHLINGPTVNARLQGGIVRDLLDRRATNEEIVDELYLRAFARRPNPVETVEWNRLLSTAPDHAEAVADLLWTILNSREFAINH